jgi:transposase
MLPDDSGLARSITVLARAYQDAVWRRTKLVQELRARLREYYPGFLAAFAAGRRLSTTQLASSDARAVLAIAPSPAEGLQLSQAKVATALRRSGRQRRIPSLSARIVAALRVPQLRHDAVVEQAMRTETLALLGVLNAVCDSVDQLTAAVIEAFTQHPDYEIITSFPGLADISGAIVLAEIGDDRTRFADDRALQAFAGSAPVTRASGKSRTVTRRRTKNNRLAAIGYSWAFTAAARPSPTREHYLHRRQHGDGHPAALRHLFNRMLGQLHHCLHTRQRYDPIKAFPHAQARHAGPVRTPLDKLATSEVSSAVWPFGFKRRWAGSRGRVHRCSEGGSRHPACGDVPGAGSFPGMFYKWRAGVLPPRAARRERLKAEINRLFRSHEGTYGHPGSPRTCGMRAGRSARTPSRR